MFSPPYVARSVGWFKSLFVLLALEEKFAQAVCFLLVDLYLLTFQPEKALHLLAVLDKLSAHGNNKNSKGEVCCCTHLPCKPTQRLAHTSQWRGSFGLPVIMLEITDYSV